jgi:nucleoside-diphosphate-sugar epimerase
MRILVTGGNGYIGSRVASGLAARGHEVCATWRSNRDRLTALSGGVEIEQLDITDNKAVDTFVKAIRPDAIVHTAALVTSEESISSIPALVASNVSATAHLAAAACAADCHRFVFTSSISVYGVGNSPSEGFTENDGKPDTLYGWSKCAGEEILGRTAIIENEFSPISLRLGGVHGGGRSGGALHSFASAALRHAPIQVAEPESRFRWAFIDDVMQGVEKALELPTSNRHRIFNLACRDIFTLFQVADMAVEMAGSKSEISISANAPVRHSTMNIDRAISELGFVASTLETNLLNYIVELRRRS